MAAHAAVGGIEIDGSHVTGVITVDGRITTVHTAHSGDAQDALEQVLARIPAGTPLRVSITGAGARTVRIQLPTANPSRETLIDSVRQALGSDLEDRAVAGLIPDTGASTGTLTAAIGAAHPVGPVDDAYTTAGRADIEVVPAAFTLAGVLDGMWLTVRWGSAELVLVESGWPVASRTLNTGGLNGVVSEMTVSLPGSLPSLDVGLARLIRVLQGDESDPAGTAVVETWQRRLALEVRSTGEHWSSQGETVPPVVYTLGPGTDGGGLAMWLKHVDLEHRTDSLLEASLVNVDPEQRLAAGPALLAARSYGVGGVAAAYPNPVAIATLARRRRRRRRVKIVALVVSIASLCGAAVAVPSIVGQTRETGAQQQLVAAQRRLAGVEEIATQQAHIARLDGLVGQQAPDAVDWAWVLGKVYTSAPPGVTVTMTSARREDDGRITVVLTARSNSDTYSAASTWLGNLADAIPGSDGWIPNLSAADGSLSFTVELSIPATAPAVIPVTVIGAPS